MVAERCRPCKQSITMCKQNINPYINDADKSPLLLRSAIAYIDVLGYKDLIDSDTSRYNLKFYRDALNWAYESLEQFSEHAAANNIDLPDLKNKYEVRGFFDNLVIGYPIEGDRTEAVLETVFSLLAHVQLRMILDGYFLRGAISVGELHLDDTIVFGKGLLEAQAAEKDDACSPRIILTASATQQLNEHSVSMSSSISRYLYRDTDKQIFLNYLENIMEAAPEGEPSYFELNTHKKIVENNLSKYIDRPKVLSKYLWVANYHNYYCEKYKKYFDDSYKIALNDYHMSSID